MTPLSGAAGSVMPPRSQAALKDTGFTSQLQTLLQRTQPAAIDPAPSRATTGHLHQGGMNDAAHRLLMLSGGSRG